MVDWTSSMQQTFEYYTVDPNTWKDVKLIDTVTSCTITRESDSETRGSATFDIAESIGECYVRAYLITIQNGVKEKHPLGTFLVQSPSSSFDGKVKAVTLDAYTPLLELKEKQPPIGYYVPKTANVMENAYRLTRENVRAPISEPKCDTTLFHDFVADTDDTWLTFLIELINNAKYYFDLDEMGRILFSPKQDTASLQPVWEFDDDNSSILYPEFSMDHDLFGIPNVVEVIYSNGEVCYDIVVTNDDPNSPISTVNRGRKVVYRETNPSSIGDPTENRIKEYAKQLLRDLSTIEYTVTYTHGYCPVRVGDCVRLNYVRAGMKNTKAKIISQSIKCEPGCPVTEKAVITTKLWG